MKIILDTNFVMDAIRFKVDIFSELSGNSLFVLDTIEKELESIEKKGTNESKLAKIALQFLKTKGLKALKSIEKNTDASLLAYSQINYAIATHDSLLRNLIRKKGGKVLYIRQRSYVVIE